MFLRVCFALLCLASARSAIQNAVPRLDFLPATEYVYGYSSFAQLYESLNLSVRVEVTVHVVTADSATADVTELQLTFRGAALTWNTTSGTLVDQDAIGDLSKWFSAAVDASGAVTHVSYPSEESSAVAAFKKGIAELFSVNTIEGPGKSTREVVGSRLVVTTATYTTHRTRRKITEKLTALDRSGLLLSVETDELVEGQQGKQGDRDGVLLGFPIHSHSSLVFTSQHSSNSQPRKPAALLQDSPHITAVKVETPLSELRHQISEKLSCAPASPTCVGQLSSLLQLLTSDDLDALAGQYLGSTAESGRSSQLVLIDAMAHLRSPTVTRTLTRHVLRSPQHRDDIVLRVLLHMATAEIPPDRDATDAVLDLAFASSGFTPAVSQRAFLTLGAIARQLRETDLELAEEVVHTLHLALEQHTGYRSGSTFHKHKRSLPSSDPPIPSLHTILIDSLGNAGAEISLPTLVSHLEGGGREMTGHLSVRHAAVKALRSYSSDQSAEALLRTAETSSHPTVRHLAARAYQSHPRRRRDLSHLLTPSLDPGEENNQLSRQRRQVDRTISNVTMPAVSWNSRFGERNISANLGRVILNSFQIEREPLTSHYNFSLHDETSFDADLLLSSGEQHSEMLRTEFCLQGRASYDVNILTDFTQNMTDHQFQRHSAAVGSLQQEFRTAYQRLVASEDGYNGLRDSLRSALADIPNQYEGIATYLEGYRTQSGQIASEFELKSRTEMVFSTINASLADTSALSLSSLPAIYDAVDTLLPSLPPALTSTLSVQGQPFTDSTFYLPYLPYAPQKALANIFSVYRRSSDAFTTLQTAVQTLRNVADKYGPNHRWLTPGVYLREVSGDVTSLLDDLDDAIDTATKSPTQAYDGATLSDLQALQRTITSFLQPSLTALEQVGGPLSTQMVQLLTAFQETRNSFDSFTSAYERTRAEIDTIFGQRFHPGFPWQLRSCDPTSGCGTYPSTSSGRFRDGIDLRVGRGQIVSPLSGTVQLLDTAALPFSYSSTSALLLTPAESSFNGIHFVISNINPDPSVTSQPRFFLSGDAIATPDDSNQITGESFIHVEAYKTVDSVQYTVNPTQFLQPNLRPAVSIEFGCNDLVTYVSGVVVERRPVAGTSLDAEFIGTPLVEGIPGQEFPQPYDLVMSGGGSVTGGEVQYLQSSTFLMVGTIPVQFDFSSTGNYQLNFSVNAGLLSKRLDAAITPYLHARAQGVVRVGTTMFANVELSGSVIETSLPLELLQDFNSWPMVASSSMDIVLAPSSLTLTTRLVQLTGTGDLQVREMQTLWEYSVPPLNRDEFYYEGRLADTTAPLFIPLAYASADQSDCFMRQLPGRPYGNPAFELDFELAELESVVNITYRAGSFQNGANVILETELGGSRIAIPHNLLPAQEIVITVSATNANRLQALASCSLPVYDRSPPMARINPIRAISSHPSKIRALVVLFDEFGFDSVQEIAVGTIPGESGSDVLPWQQFNTSQIDLPPDLAGDVLNLFSFSRNGRLPGGVLQTAASTSDVVACANLCNDLDSCRSFDYSRLETNCILHSNIEGPYVDPATSFENNFNTPPLRPSRTYSHYEKLGIGNSTTIEFSGLTFTHNRVYYINMRLRNKLGYANVVSSAGFLVDLSPPTPGKIRNAASNSVRRDGCSASVIAECIDPSGEPNHRVIVDGPGSATIFNGPTPLLDAMFTSASNLITANWQGFSDAESGIHGYAWCVGTSVGSCDLISSRDPHTTLLSREAWTNTGLATSLSLTDGPYYITVEAVSRVVYGGPLVTTVHHSTPYVVDTTAPVLSEVEILEYNVSSNRLIMTYNASDPGSGVSAVSLALGRTPRDTALLPWTEVEVGGYVEVEVVIPDGVPTWVKIRARNNAGLQTIAVAEAPIMVDRTPPMAGTVGDGTERGDVDYQSDLTTLCVSWESFRDPESGIAEIHWGIGIIPGTFSVRSLMPLSPLEVSRRSACVSGLSLIRNATYYSTLIAFNGAVNQQAVSVTSDGVHTDTTPPLPGTIFDGPDPSIDHTHSSSLTTVHVTWAGFEDYESGVSRYLLTVFRQPFGGDAQPLTTSDSVQGDQREMTWNSFSFANGDYIFVQIDAFNGAGLVTAVNSSGIIIDLTPPQLVYIVDGSDPSNDLQYQISSTSLSTRWEVRDDQSGISQIEGAIFEVREGRKMRVIPNPFFDDATTVTRPSGASSWPVNDLRLTSGSKYVAAISFTNGAGLRVQYESNGVIVDTTPPIVQRVSVLTDSYTDAVSTNLVLANPNQIEARWIAFDPETGIREYLVGVVDENSTFVTPGGQDYISFGTSTGGLIENLALAPGSGPYRVAVVGVNFAGARSAPFYSEPFSVTVGDSAGVVYDGEDPASLEIDYTDELTAVTAHFSGFSSQSCGGLVRYEWAVGVEEEGEGREAVMPFTNVGIVVIGTNGTGYAQVLLPDLASYEEQSLYVTVRGITGCGRVLESTSNGFIIDPTPPSLEMIGTGNRAIERAQLNGDLGAPIDHEEYQTEAGFSSIWTVADDESGITDDVSVKVGTYPGGENVEARADVSQSYLRSTVMSAKGLPNYVTVAAINGAGLESVAISNPVVMDATPPFIGELTCRGIGYPSPTLLWGTSAGPSTTGTISCEWRRVHDPESGVTQYSVAIGTSPTDQSVLSKTRLVGNSSLDSFNSPWMTFDPSVAYYVILYATNGAGLETITTSSAVYFDVSPPVSEGLVTVLPNVETASYHLGTLTNRMLDNSSAVCLLDTDVVAVLFNLPSDPESGILRHEIGLGYSSGNDDILRYHSFDPTPLIGTTVMHVITPLSLTQVGPRAVYFSVKSYNTETIHSVISSNPIFIKSNMNLRPSWIFDGSNPNADSDFQTSTTDITGWFHIGTNCPIRSARWAVESVDGMLAQDYVNVSILDSVATGNRIENTFFLSSDLVQLYNDETYRILVQAVDYSGEVHILRSNGTSVTTRSLPVGLVQDGPIIGQDLNYQESTTTLAAHWSRFGDNSPEQRITYYEVAAGSNREYVSTRSDVAPFTNVSLNTSHTFFNLDLVLQTVVYYITVRAHAVSGEYVDATSNGITAGYGHMIIPGVISIPRYQSDTTTVSVHWSDFESDLPIRSYEWALGTRRFSDEELSRFCSDSASDFSDEFEVFGFTAKTLETSVSQSGLNLQHNTTYYVTIRALDQALKCTATESYEGLTIDRTTPLVIPPSSISVGPPESLTAISATVPHVIYVRLGHALEVTWDSFSDAESGIARYEVSIRVQAECGNSSVLVGSVSPDVEFINVGTDRDIVYEGLNLVNGVAYVAEVRATNQAGLTSSSFSEPFLVDSTTPVVGDVKDGSVWEDDVVFQSDLSMLSAVFAHAKLPPQYPGVIDDGPCPNTTFYEFSELDPAWTRITPSNLIGSVSTAITYERLAPDLVAPSLAVDPMGVKLTAVKDVVTGSERIISAAYQTQVQLSNGGIVSLDIRAALGALDFQSHAITSVVFIDSGSTPDILAEFEPELLNFDYPSSPSFNAFGIQLHHSFMNGTRFDPQKILMWYKSADALANPEYVIRELSYDLSEVHTYTLVFEFQQLGVSYSRKVDLFIDGDLVASLHGLPAFTDDTRIVMHVFNRQGFVPETENEFVTPTVEAIFGNVTLPLTVGHLCDFGMPFFSKESPIVEFRAAAGTTAGATDVRDWETVSLPCQPCLPGPCSSYGCESNCTQTDPYLTTIIFQNLTLSHGYYTNQSYARDEFESTNQNAANTMISLLSDHFQPATYYITVEAITASGQLVTSTSNGVIIDTTPPELVSPIEHFDISFSAVIPTRFQGNDHTISARWMFRDLQSGIAEYLWAIGTRPFLQDVQVLESVGTATEAMNASLLGILEPNSTYYVTVVAVNGARASSNATSQGITYVATELNQTELELLVQVEFVEVLSVTGDNGAQVDVLRSEEEDRTSISWEGVPEDVEQIFWYIGSEMQTTDILPRTEVSFGNSRSAAVDGGILYLDNVAFANISEILALAEGRGEDPADSSFYFEPGRLFYHSLEFCNFVHRCVVTETNPNILIRTKDFSTSLGVGGTDDDVTLTATQAEVGGGSDPSMVPVLDKTHRVTLTSRGGLDPGSRLFTGFLNNSDVTQHYRVSRPYISNPHVSMARTSLEIARRFTEIGGPSFFVSFLGQDSLNGQLVINATFDPTLNWATARPELVYWDIDELLWREIGATCPNTSVIDWTTFTITAEMCSTVLTTSTSRPGSLTRRRRQATGVVGDSGSGSAADETSFLDRPAQFLVIAIGNFSVNTPPRLNLPTSPLQVAEDGGGFTYQLNYSDAENDNVNYHLASLPKLGNATLSLTGLLAYTPCPNCIGMDTLEIYIVEQPFGINNVPLTAAGQLHIEIANQNDKPEIFFYDPSSGIGNTYDVIANRTVYAYIEANRTVPTVAVQIASFDYDGYHDDLTISVQSDRGVASASFQIWMDAVNTPESLPINWLSSSAVTSYTDYIAFVSANITYLPSDSTFTGTDQIRVLVQDSNRVPSEIITVEIEVLPSWCVNNGVCGGSELDPNCADIDARRAGFEGYNCSCPSGFGGTYCEVELDPPILPPPRVCPVGVPLVQCEGDPCAGAVCPSHPLAECRGNFCGGCTAEWYEGATRVQCSATPSPDVCLNPLTGTTTDCRAVSCDCPPAPYTCPEDSILVEVRQSDCCVTYECSCPEISCPYLMECGQGVQPLPRYRGNRFPGRCCPDYSYGDINECLDGTQNTCSDLCTNQDYSFSCSCPRGTTLAPDGISCGVCHYSGLEYLHGDRVKIGCNWCICQSDALSGERWHCTARSCTPGCTYNGQFYSVGTTVTGNIHTCTCASTDTNAEWECALA